jgi:tRNA-2-methylthio-N6-dimethylallyladenosine synthase
MLQGEISLRKNKATVGSVQEILIEGKAKLKRDQLMGRTRNNKIVNFLGGADQVGRLAPVRIAGATPNSLSGELLDRNVESRYLYSQGA